MSLLTKEERETMTKDERKALRQERRAERRATRGPFLGIEWKILEPIAEELILEIAGDLLPGEDKMEEVVEELSLRADEFLTWHGLPVIIATALEIIDGPIIQAISRGTIQPLVQKVYERLRAEGKIGGAE